MATCTAFDLTNVLVTTSTIFADSVPINEPRSWSLMSSRTNEWLRKAFNGNKRGLSLRKRVSNASMSDQAALHASHAARNIFEEPEIRLEPEFTKQWHKRSTKPVVLAWSKIFLSVSLRAEPASGTEVKWVALRPWATLDNMMVMQALDSYKTLPHASSLQPTTYIVNTMRKQEISAYLLPKNVFCTIEGIRPVKKSQIMQPSAWNMNLQCHFHNYQAAFWSLKNSTKVWDHSCISQQQSQNRENHTIDKEC